jgi:hypothetical protein
VARVHGTWSLSDAGPAATTITWAWEVEPRSRAAAATMPAFGWFWRGYARTSLARLDALLV